MNKFRTMQSKRMKDALCRPGNLSLRTHADQESAIRWTTSSAMGTRQHLRGRNVGSKRDKWDARHALAEFSEFVKRKDSKALLPAMEAIAAVGTWEDVS